MRKHPIWYLIIGITILIVPTFTYLCFLVPKLSEEYNILMASGGIIGGAGMYGVNQIPDKLKYSSMFKLAGNAFTILTIAILIEKFLTQIIFLIALFIVCFIIFTIFKEKWRDGKQRKQNDELAKEIARNITENTK